MLDEKWLFRGINILIWGAIAHFSYYVLDELKRILGIRIFHVVPKTTSSNPQKSIAKSPVIVDSKVIDLETVKKSTKKAK